MPDRQFWPVWSYHCTQTKYFTVHGLLKIHCYFTYSACDLHFLTTLSALLTSYRFIIISLHELFLDEDPVSNLRNLICCTSNHFMFSVQSLDFEFRVWIRFWIQIFIPCVICQSQHLYTEPSDYRNRNCQ